MKNMMTGQGTAREQSNLSLELEIIKTLDRPIDPSFLRRVSAETGIDVFIETGTFYGETTAAAAEIFSVVHTIELSQDLYERAVRRFSGIPRIHVHHGDSEVVLTEILPGITKPVMFWLDAHYSEVNTARGRKNTPIVDELRQIHASGIRDALILIDDLRCFQAEDADTRDSLRGYPSANDIRALVQEIDPHGDFIVMGDVAVAAIGSISISPTPLLRACTISRCHEDSDPEGPEVVAAEAAIASCANRERNALLELTEAYRKNETFRLGGHYRLWRGLVRANQGQVDPAREDFLAAVTLGCNYRRVHKYLARLPQAQAATVTAMDTTGELRAIEQCIRPGSVIVDVGANIGSWTRTALSKTTDLEVHLFEASPITFQRLQAELSQPPSSRCFINQIALGNDVGQKVFYHYEDAPAWSTFYRRVDAERQFGKGPPIEIPVTQETLDRYTTKHSVARIDYLKIDVEGAEYDVLTGASDLLRRGAISYIQFEYGGTYADADITLRLVYSFLRQYGYFVFRIEPTGFVPITEYQPSLETYAYSNFIAVNERLVSQFTGEKPKMLDLEGLLSTYRVRPRGVIHIGAHEGREADTYHSMGVAHMLFVEANPAVFKTLQQNLRHLPQAMAVNAAVTDFDGTTTLHVTSMDQSSSILPLADHSKIYPGIVETSQIVVPAHTLDSLLAEHNLDPRDFNVLNIDIQGAELMALRGSERCLAHVEAINTEVNYAELYRDCALIDSLDEFLDQHGFTRIATTTPFHPTWGDALYIRKPVLSMTTLGKNGRFANQIFQYAFLKIQAERYGCRVTVPEWIGRQLFGTEDDRLGTEQLPELRQALDQDFLACDIVNSESPLRNVDLWGYFQYHTRFYAPHKTYFRSLFHPIDTVRAELGAAISRIRSGTQTLVGLHLRRGDYGYRIFYITPSEWYRRWLAEIWPTLENPVLYIASDDLDTVLEDFSDYDPVCARDLGVSIPDAEFYPDFYVLTQCDHVAISNSSFSFAACLLNERARRFVRPDLNAGCLVDFDPWDSEPLQRDAMAEDHGPPFLAQNRSSTDRAAPDGGERAHEATIGPRRRDIPRISVYITSYNQKAWLKEAIDSALAQTIQPFEIIIVDDASEDGSQALIEEYCRLCPDLVRAIFHDTNQGIGRSRMDALRAVRGDYVTYVDGDDRLLPEKIEKEIETLAAHPDAELVYSNFYFIDSEGERTGIWAGDDDVVHTGWIFPYVFARDFPKRTLFRNETVSLAALKRIGFMDPTLDLFEDFELRIRLTLDVTAAYCDHLLAEYRRHPGGLSNADAAGYLASLDYIYNKNIALLGMLNVDDREYISHAYQEWVSNLALAVLARDQRALSPTYHNSSDDGRNLIFLVAPPGSGGELLQSALGLQGSILPIGGPGVLSPAIDVLGVDSHTAYGQLQAFLQSLPGGADHWHLAFRNLAEAVYSRALEGRGGELCLESTWRYVDHCALIRRVFPKARFIVMLRHPGAILDSHVHATTGLLGAVAPSTLDELRTIPARLLACISQLGLEAIVVRYEELISQPDIYLRRLCARLDITFNPRMLEVIQRLPRSASTADEVPADAWIERLISDGNESLTRAFLDGIGPDILGRLGYFHDATVKRIDEHCGAANASKVRAAVGR